MKIPKVPLDLFGQVPISRLDVKRKCRVMSGSADKIVHAVVLGKIAATSGLVYQMSNYKRIQRQSMEEELCFRLQQAEKYYGALCRVSAQYHQEVNNLKSMAKNSFDTPNQHDRRAHIQIKRRNEETQALELIALAKFNGKLTVTLSE